MSDAKQAPDNDIINSVKDYVKMPLLYNHWYVAGTIDEFGRKPIAKTLLEHSIIFYRTEAGQLTALQNRCLHRSFPMAEARQDGDDLICRYHGARYSPDGTLLNIPCQKATPDRALRKYPLLEKGSFVFIWMGSGEPDVAKMEPLSYLDDQNFRNLHGHYEINGSYLLMQENLNDQSHFAFLHHDSFGVEEEFVETPVKVVKRGGRVASVRTESNTKVVLTGLIPGKHRENLIDKKLTRWDESYSISPGAFLTQLWTFVDDEAELTPETMQVFIVHYLTPVTQNSCLYWWSVAINHGQDDDQFFEGLPLFLDKGFSEDVWACASMQNLLETDKVDFKELNIAGDQAGLYFRKIMLDWATSEYGS